MDRRDRRDRKDRMDHVRSSFGIRIGQQIGRGSYGLINIVEGFLTDRRGHKYVIKSIDPEADGRESPRGPDTLYEEILMTQKAGLLGIGPRVLSWTPDYKSFIMDLVPGITLTEYIYKGYPLKPVIPRLIDMVHTLHENGIYHNDLNNSNVIVSRDGSVRIIDYGLSTERPKKYGLAMNDQFAVDRWLSMVRA